MSFIKDSVKPNHYLHQPYLLWEHSHSLHDRELKQYDKRCPHPWGKWYLTSGLLELFFHLLLDESTMSCWTNWPVVLSTAFVIIVANYTDFQGLWPTRRCPTCLEVLGCHLGINPSSIICITQMVFSFWGGGWFRLQGMEWSNQMVTALSQHPNMTSLLTGVENAFIKSIRMNCAKGRATLSEILNSFKTEVSIIVKYFWFNHRTNRMMSKLYSTCQKNINTVPTSPGSLAPLWWNALLSFSIHLFQGISCLVFFLSQ